jgi:hypothetical protein
LIFLDLFSLLTDEIEKGFQNGKLPLAIRRRLTIMKMLEKLTKGAGIALNYIAGLGFMWFGAICTLISLGIWGISGFGAYSAIFFVLFGATPIGGGALLFRRGRIQQQLFKVKLLKEAVRKLAFKRQGRLRPIDLAQDQDYTEERALDVLKNLTAEDPNRIELQLDYDSGEIYFEFSDIIRAIEAQREYQALPISETLEKKAVEMAQVLGKTVETFHEYIEYTQQAASDHQKQKKVEKYKQKVERFLNEIDELKQQ